MRSEHYNSDSKVKERKHETGQWQNVLRFDATKLKSGDLKMVDITNHNRVFN